MSFKNVTADIATMDVHISNAKNKVGKVVSLIIAIIALILGLITLVFSWKVAFVFFGIAILFFIFFKLADYATKVNESTIKKLQKMKDPSPNERL